jgi:hypothetical protein
VRTSQTRVVTCLLQTPPSPTRQIQRHCLSNSLLSTSFTQLYQLKGFYSARIVQCSLNVYFKFSTLVTVYYLLAITHQPARKTLPPLRTRGQCLSTLSMLGYQCPVGVPLQIGTQTFVPSILVHTSEHGSQRLRYPRRRRGRQALSALKYFLLLLRHRKHTRLLQQRMKVYPGRFSALKPSSGCALR